MSWADFEASAPAMGRTARSMIERSGFVYIATLRRDGTPRISPVEAHIVRDQLMLVMVAASRKAQDAARDPRVTLQSPIAGPADPGDELKLRGRLAEVDEEQRAATTEAVEARSGWRPESSWRFFAVEIEAVAVLTWVRGEMLLSRWTRPHGLRPPLRARLDLEASAYRPVR